MILLYLVPLAGVVWAGYSQANAGYSTGQAYAPVGGGCGAGGCAGGGGVSSYDFNPVLLGGQRGYPGIRARLNQRAFQYASGIVGDLLNSEIKKARIPPISQCIPQVNGCIQVYNLYVSRYRCPQRVVIYPAAPNRVILSVQNVDIGVTGNLGGQIVILLPIALFGIVQLNLHQVSVTVDLAIERGATGPYVRVNSCNVQVGYADAYVENGGLVGDITNSQFRSQISGMVRKMIPSQVCAQIPSIVNEKINSKAGSLPQTVSLTQMLSLFGGALGLGSSGPSAQYCQQQCPVVLQSTAQSAAASANSAPAPVPAKAVAVAQSQTASSQVAAVPAPAPQVVAPAPQIPQASYGAAPAPQIPTEAYNAGRKAAARGTAQQQYATGQTAGVSRQLSPIPTQRYRTFRAVTYSDGNSNRLVYVPVTRAKRQAAQRQILQQVVNRSVRHNGYQQQPPAAVYQAPPAVYQALAQSYQAPAQSYQAPSAGYQAPAAPAGYVGGSAVGSVRGGSKTIPGVRLPPPPPVPGVVAPSNPAPFSCSQCPASGSAEDPVSFIKQLAAHLDMSKLNDLYLGIQLQNTYATSNDFTIDLTGEFSPLGQGGTPFYAFPVSFPAAYDTHMAEFIVSDYTLNSLFYHLHRKQFLSFRIGPDTPKIGELLKTTCSEDEDELEGSDVELDEESARKRRRKSLNAVKTYLSRSRRSSHHHHKKHRKRRQDADAGLADLGICFGDILPAVREKYPNQKIAIQIRTVRAPSVVLSSAKGGSATLDLIADADIYIDGTNNKVGTITIAATVVIAAQVSGNRISGSAEITQLKLTDRSGTLGLPQDALDNLGNLGKELLQKLANDALGKGIVLNVPSSVGGLPLNLINPSFRIIEHGLYIATDFTIQPSLLGQLAGGGQC